ncbi:hypothetical protein [Xylanibacter muris]|uniref:hypothetical protein n=1 Tax=Xylanibacter muris TaxID=2736290 RepID=UPI000FFE4A75|nr:hypothetical protein [Xylanibacter muris]RXE72209.1 hypothetical protein ED352_01780 [Muribaculaceae bacterium Isolate-002 (NCI)]
MRTFNTPAQARSLREIEAAAITPISEQIKDVYGEVQSVPAPESEVVEKTNPQAEAEETAKKSRSKKNPKAV